MCCTRTESREIATIIVNQCPGCGGIWLDKGEIVALNRLVTIHSGGTSAAGTNIRPGQSLGFVERIFVNSVFGRPVYPDICLIPGAYMFFIIKNHVFIDGNKRTGLATAVMFLRLNGIEIAFADEGSAYSCVMRIAAGENDPHSRIPEIAAWLEKSSIR